MNKEPILVILAAGMGSRYGGLKQMDSVDEFGDSIIDFSMYDAYKAGFKKVVFIIKKEIEELFKEKVGNRVAKKMQVEYAYQELDKVPSFYQVNPERVKPWGTGHALLCAKEFIDAPFAIINSDDYYGCEAYKTIYNFLKNVEETQQPMNFAMMGYVLKNTLTKNGSVARGVCVMDSNKHLQDIKERSKIVETEKGGAYLAEDGTTWVDLPADTLVSMNFWGFTPSIFAELETKFEEFLKVNTDPLKGEFFIPLFVGDLVHENKAVVQVLQTNDAWFGVTYKEDKPNVVAKIKALREQGVYPDHLWD